MSEEQTGATPAQIEAAARRYYQDVPESDFSEDGAVKRSWEAMPVHERDMWSREHEASAFYLVPMDHRIVAVEDLDRLVELAQIPANEADVQGSDTSELQAFIDRMRALAVITEEAS